MRFGVLANESPAAIASGEPYALGHVQSKLRFRKCMVAGHFDPGAEAGKPEFLCLVRLAHQTPFSLLRCSLREASFAPTGPVGCPRRGPEPRRA